jgi:hypothetical protein
VCNPQDRLIPWIGDVAAAPILADMAMAVVEKGKDPRAAAKGPARRFSETSSPRVSRTATVRVAGALPRPVLGRPRTFP